MFKPLKAFLLPVLGLMIVSFSCRKSDTHKKASSEKVNSFSMKMDGQLWVPSTKADDTCYSTYRCEWSAVDNIPYYTIEAYKDPQLRTRPASENIFRLQVMDVTDPGVYNIDGSYEGDFTSHAFFIINTDNEHKMYVNSTGEANAVVRVEEIIPQAHLSVPGISGSFSGVLYNVDNKEDSIVISDCEFVFKKTNGDFNQCTD